MVIGQVTEFLKHTLLADGIYAYPNAQITIVDENDAPLLGFVPNYSPVMLITWKLHSAFYDYSVRYKHERVVRKNSEEYKQLLQDGWKEYNGKQQPEWWRDEFVTMRSMELNGYG